MSITTGNQTALPTENRRPHNASQCFWCTLATSSPIQIQVYIFLLFLAGKAILQISRTGCQVSGSRLPWSFGMWF